MKIAIIGSGGVGGYFGGKLAKAGNEVIFVARGNHLKAMQQKGLIVKSLNGDFSVDKVHATDDLGQISGADLIIIGVKAWQLKEVANNIKPWVRRDTVILPLQNGVTAFDELKEVLPQGHIINGLCRIFSKIEAPGIINHFGVDPVIVFGENDNSKSQPIEKILDIFAQSDIKGVVPDNIQSELWKKFIAICVSGLLAVTKTTYGQLRELPETRKMMIELLEEVYTISQKLNIPIKPDFVSKTVAFIDTFPYETTSSLTRDVLEGKPSEIEYQNGTVVRLANQLGLETPVNRFVYACILPMEMKARGLMPV